MEREQVGVEERWRPRLGHLEEATPDLAAPELEFRWGGDVGQVLVDEGEALLRWNARQEIAGVEAQLDLSRVLAMGEDVLPGDREALLEEIGDGEGTEVEDLRSAERVETVPRSKDQHVLDRDSAGEARERPERDREPGLLGRRLERVRVLGQPEANRS